MDTPLSNAHCHASNAEDAYNKGLLIPAAEEHYKAAELFKACIEQATDESNKRTMRMLHDQHIKAGRELQRRIAKLREEKKDPSLPQIVPSIAPPTTVRASPTPPQQQQQQQQQQQPLQQQRKLTDSQYTVDESFMVLGGQRSDPGDAFNQFWKIMEGMLDNLSQPVAFATIPLAFDQPSGPMREGSLSSDTDIDDTSAGGSALGWKRRMGIGRRMGGSGGKEKGKEEDLVDLGGDSDVEVLVDDGSDLAESFYFIPSADASRTSGPSPALAADVHLRKENASLKAEIEAMQRRLAQTERVLQMRREQDQQLKDSIVLARQQAQRAMVASMTPGTNPQRQGGVMDLGALNVGQQQQQREREAQLTRRTRELEEETKFLKVENEKQRVMIAKFRERWEKLKESAKRKKEAKAAAIVTAITASGSGEGTIAVEGGKKRVEMVPEEDELAEMKADG